MLKMSEKMNNKTCGECKYFVTSNYLDVCVVECETRRADSACNLCDEFAPKVITNGDRIIAGGNRAIAEFQQQNTCDNCVYNNHSGFHNYCDKPVDKTCADGIEAWLNAPAESEG